MPSRVSTTQMFDTSVQRATEARRQETKSARTAGTLQRLAVPSDDPQSWRIAQDAKDQVNLSNITTKNASLANSFLGATDILLGRVQDYVQQLGKMAISAAGSAMGENALEAIHKEAAGLVENALQTLNTRFGNRTLLGGFQNKGPAFDQEGRYLGDSGQIMIEIERGHKVPVNLTGDVAILGKGMRDGVDLGYAMVRLVEGLEKRNPELIQSTLDDFQRGVDQLSIARSQVAAWMNKIDRAIVAEENDRLERTELIGILEGADAVEAFSNFARDQTTLKAVLETSRKVLHEVPPDYLLKLT